MTVRITTGALSLLLFCFLLSAPISGHAEIAASTVTKQDLFVSCLNEAERVDGKRYAFQAPSRGHSVPTIPAEVYQAKELCRQMRDGQDKNPQTALANDCGAYLGQYASKHASDEQHVKAMQNICQNMTGERVVLNNRSSSLNEIVPAAGDIYKIHDK